MTQSKLIKNKIIKTYPIEYITWEYATIAATCLWVDRPDMMPSPEEEKRKLNK